jgi:hypothetical protein
MSEGALGMTLADAEGFAPLGESIPVAVECNAFDLQHTAPASELSRSPLVWNFADGLKERSFAG